jgi:uncharacterized protein RhaS with RHS repeats
MKTRLNLAGMGMGLLFLLGSLHTASAFYDPGLQRWLNRDPIEEEGSINLFGYVENDPADSLDPIGLSCWTKAIKIYKAIGKERKLVAKVKEASTARAVAGVKEALDTVDKSKGAERVVTTADKAGRNALTTQLSRDGRLRACFENATFLL